MPKLTSVQNNILHFIKNWGSRIKVIYHLKQFLSLREVLSLIKCWGVNLLFYPQKGVVIFEEKKINTIRKWLEQKYEHFVPKTLETIADGNKKEDETIWVFWYQGKDSMPEIVQVCYNSILQNANDHNVILVTKDNLNTLIKIPDYILQKVEQGFISLTHLSDIVRVCLIYEHGGLWMDSTLLATGPIKTKSFNSMFYSIKNNPIVAGTISNYRWTGFFLYGRRNSQAFKIFKDLFFEYWKENNSLIEYFLIDYFFDLLYNKNGTFRKEIDEIPFSNPGIHILERELNSPYQPKLMNKLNLSTSVYKLTFKKHFLKEVNGQQTLYGFIVNKHK